MTYQTILFSLEDGLATVTLNRPDKLNSFNVQMHEELRAALEKVRQSGETRALLLTGAGRGFCAGQDLGDRRGGDIPDLGLTLDKYYNPLIRLLRHLEFPVICAVNGVAAGAGANLALACDIVIAARSASFIQAFCKIGLVPDSGGTWFLPRMVGVARATALAMLGDKLPAEQAADWGLIWRCVDDEQLHPEAEKLARHLATQPTKALALIKRALNASAKHSLDEQLDMERDFQRIAGGSADYREGVAAFLDKRTPVFKGH